jgi:hypothetical protein
LGRLRIRAVATAPAPKISTITVNAQRRSVTTSLLTAAVRNVPGLVGNTARPLSAVVVLGVVVEGGVVVGVVVGVVGRVKTGGATAARSATLPGAEGVVGGGGGGGVEWEVGGGGLVGVVGGGGGLVGGGGGGGGGGGLDEVGGGSSPRPMQMIGGIGPIGSRQILNIGAMTCSVPTGT